MVPDGAVLLPQSAVEPDFGKKLIVSKAVEEEEAGAYADENSGEEGFSGSTACVLMVMPIHDAI